MNHPAIAAGHVAVITGAASGIGLAAAERFADLGMKVCLADANEMALDGAAASIASRTGRAEDLLAVPTDVSRRDDVERLKDTVDAAFGAVAVLMNNAGREGGGGRERIEIEIPTGYAGPLRGRLAVKPRDWRIYADA